MFKILSLLMHSGPFRFEEDCKGDRARQCMYPYHRLLVHYRTCVIDLGTEKYTDKPTVYQYVNL